VEAPTSVEDNSLSSAVLSIYSISSAADTATPSESDYTLLSSLCTVWNSLLNVVVLASSLDTFKNRLDRLLWGNQDVRYDYTAELTGAGSRSEFYIK